NRPGRGSTMVLGMLAAFFGGTLILCGGAYLVLRARMTAPTAAAETPSAIATAPGDPLPPAIEPAPPLTGAPTDSAPKATASGLRPHAPPRPAVMTTASATATAPAATPPPKPAVSNPLLL